MLNPLDDTKAAIQDRVLRLQTELNAVVQEREISPQIMEEGVKLANDYFNSNIDSEPDKGAYKNTKKDADLRLAFDCALAAKWLDWVEASVRDNDFYSAITELSHASFTVGAMSRSLFETNKRSAIAGKGGDVKAASDPKKTRVDEALDYYLAHPEKYSSKDKAAGELADKFEIPYKTIRNKIIEPQKK